jgi:hypothetical protein
VSSNNLHEIEDTGTNIMCVKAGCGQVKAGVKLYNVILRPGSSLLRKQRLLGKENF